MREYWNHNVAYHPHVLRAVPERCETALDVGCGDGLLAAKLSTRAERVTGLDTSAEMIDLARRRGGDLTFVEGDFLTSDLPAAHYDVITCVAAIHHMDFGRAVARAAELLRPGGRLVVLGVARDADPADYAWAAVAVPVNKLLRRVMRERDPGAPVTPPEMTWAEVRARAAELLPGSRFRRHLLWRYSLVWSKPLPTPGRAA
ncbi:class I SAM-dependent methyltransferase [Nonomuraea sp. NBC_01738]|uniref:class I SAM-dependent methyltransferase n=1 Tax=Nonomuraea sp. NBC_01738 TaxID=2976003 RepID=UPI002E1517A5|nr:class I SAM-dependent methyltransferase [Nonomuraea sp. NBC_01738]